MRTLLFPLLLALFGLGATAFGQTEQALLRQLAEENKKSVDALALYPQDARLAILESAKYPEVLIKMKSAQEKTSAAFRTLIEDFPRTTQDVFFDLTRYPGVITTLVGRRDDRSALRQALEILPAGKRDEALQVAERQAGTLASIDHLTHTAQAAFEKMISTYPAPAQAAFRQLLNLPEVIDILNEDLRFTVLVGDVYLDNPAWVIQKMDSLNLAVAREHAEELDNWQKTIENDPQTRQELQSAASEYANEYGYADSGNAIQNDDLYADGYAAGRSDAEQYYSNSYPYWFGYPWWAPQPCWRPYPYWWYWGFYPQYQSVVIVYLPSYHFMHWYFDRPHHHYQYNHLSTHFVNHYYGHRHSGTTISSSVGEWRNRNRELVSDTWMSEPTQLPARLREFGRFEEKREQYNAKNPARQLSRTEFLTKNPRQYPDLERSHEQARTEIQNDRSEQDRQRADWAPRKEPVQPATTAPDRQQPRATQPARPNTPITPKRQEPTTPAQPSQRPERPATQPAKKPGFDDAKDYHRDKWETPQRSEPTSPKPAATPKTRERTPPATTKPAQTPRQRGG